MNKFAKILSKITKNGFYIILFLCICAIGISGYVMYRTPEMPSETEIFDDWDSSFELPFPEEEVMDYDAQEVVVSEPIEIPDQVVMEDAEPDVVPTAATEKEIEREESPKAIEYVSAVDGDISLPYSGEELIKSKTMGDWRVHSGVDIAAEEGAKVRAIAEGTVTDIYEDDMMGHTVVIEHKKGTVSTYSNLMKGIVVKKGDKVKGGDVIGGIGSSALAECMETPHLHLELTVDGEPVDPMKCIEK